MPPLLELDNTGFHSYTLDGAVKSLVGSLTFSASGALTLSGATADVPLRVENVRLPVDDTDAANKRYIDDRVNGLTLKAPVRCATTENVDLSILSAGSTIDGIVLVSGDRVLVKDQLARVNNGIYIVQDSGVAAIRDAALGQGSSIAGVYCFVDEGQIGSVNVDRSFVCTTSGECGTDEQVWVQYAAQPAAYQGFGLKLDGTTSTRLEVDHAYVPLLAQTNVFTGASNTFEQSVVAQTSLQTPVATVETIPTAMMDASQNSAAVPPAHYQNAVNWQYLYNTMRGLSWKQPVRVVHKEDLGTEGLVGFPTVVDGVSLEAGNRFLLINQTTDPLLHGVYRYMGAGIAPVRTDDMPVGTRAEGVVVVVMQGTLFADKPFLCTSDTGGAQIGVSADVRFEIMGQSAEGLAGAGIVVGTNDSLDVNLDGSTLSLDSNGRVQIVGGINNAVLGDKSNTMTQPVRFEDNTPSTSRTSGSVVIHGGLGVSGNVHCTGVYNHSDQRLKTDIQDIAPEAALDALATINGCTFQWRDSGAPSVGVIAQDVLAVAPLAVETNSEYLSVDYSRLIPYLIQGIKGLKNRLDRRVRKRRTERVPHDRSLSALRKKEHTARLLRAMGVVGCGKKKPAVNV